MADYQQRVEAIVAALDGNIAEAARRLRVGWPTVQRWLRGRPPTNRNNIARIEEVNQELGLTQ